MQVIWVVGDFWKLVWKMPDHICETKSKVGVQMRFRVFCARVGTSQREKSNSRDLGPNAWIIEILRARFGFFRRAYPKSETTFAYKLSILVHTPVLEVFERASEQENSAQDPFLKEKHWFPDQHLHSRLRRDLWWLGYRKFRYLIDKKTFDPYCIGCRRAYGCSASGLFKKSNCSPLCGLVLIWSNVFYCAILQQDQRLTCHL